MRGEVQGAAINGTTDAVCYSAIDSPGQQSGEATSAWIELKFKWRHNYSINKQRKLLGSVHYCCTPPFMPEKSLHVIAFHSHSLGSSRPDQQKTRSY